MSEEELRETVEFEKLKSLTNAGQSSVTVRSSGHGSIITGTLVETITSDRACPKSTDCHILSTLIDILCRVKIQC